MTIKTIEYCLIAATVLTLAWEFISNTYAKRKAHRRLYRIAHLIRLSDGHEYADSLYQEAMRYVHACGIMPEEFSLESFAHLESCARQSLERYIRWKLELYKTTYAEWERRLAELQKQPGDVELMEAVSGLGHIVHSLKGQIAYYEGRRAHFKLMYETPCEELSSSRDSLLEEAA